MSTDLEHQLFIISRYLLATNVSLLSIVIVNFIMSCFSYIILPFAKPLRNVNRIWIRKQRKQTEDEEGINEKKWKRKMLCCADILWCSNKDKTCQVFNINFLHLFLFLIMPQKSTTSIKKNETFSSDDEGVTLKKKGWGFATANNNNKERSKKFMFSIHEVER